MKGKVRAGEGRAKPRAAGTSGDPAGSSVFRNKIPPSVFFRAAEGRDALPSAVCSHWVLDS